MMLSPEEMAEQIPDCPVFLRLYQTYERQKRERKLFDYDDMLTYTLTVFRRYPQILHTFAQRYQYLNVDEAQDTSRIQHEIIRMLVSAAGENLSLFMVGDEDQSIYGFRGAFPQALLQFPKLYPGGKKKAFNITYDDGVLQDERFVALLNKYGIKGTFNLNSQLMREEFSWVHPSRSISRMVS